MHSRTDSTKGRTWSTFQVAAVTIVCALLAHGLARWRSESAAKNGPTRTTTSSDAGQHPNRGPSTAPSVTSFVADTSNQDWKARWQQLHDQTASPQRDRQLAGMIEQLAQTAPDQALALAAAETSWRLSDELRDAALRGWASNQPDAAGDWALKVRPEDRRQAVAAVLAGASAQPDSAAKLALRLCAADPEIAGDYGHSAIAALIERGHFEHAAQFGVSIGAEKYPFLLRSAYYQWARNDPAGALVSAQRIENSTTREQVVAEALSGWAHVDAQALTEYARTLPAGRLRENALAQSLPNWVERDPNAAAQWINQQETHGELDAGIEAVANLQSLVTGRPSTAMDLAASIFDQQRRSHTLRTVFRQWATNDLAAATRYVSAASPADRALLDAELKDMQPN